MEKKPVEMIGLVAGTAVGACCCPNLVVEPPNRDGGGTPVLEEANAGVALALAGAITRD